MVKIGKIKSVSILYCAIMLVLTACVLFPLVCVVLTPSVKNVLSVFASRVWRGAMRNTLVECVCSTLLSVAIGYVFAYAVTKADIPFRRIFALIPVLHLMTPPFVGGLSFILLFGRQGFITHTLFGLDVSLYGFAGLLIAQTLCFFPIAYLICAQVLKGIHPSFGQAARSMGASRVRIFCTITLPLSLPGIISSALFIAVSVLSDFGNPMIVAGRFRVLAVEVYTQLTGWVDAGTSCVLGMILLIPSVVLFILQNYHAKKNGILYATIGERGSGLPEKKSSCATRAVLLIFCLVVSLLVVAQFAAIVAGAFQTLWGINTSLTLNHLLAVGTFSRELANSLFFAFVAAVLSTVLAGCSVFLVERTRLPFRKYVAICAQIPAAVPGSLFGLALSLSAARLNIRASGVMIVVAMAFSFLPFSYRIVASVLAQIRTTLDDGAQSLGAGKLRVFGTILFPLCSGGFFSAFVYDFIRGVGTLSSVIFLVSFGTPLASIKILNLAEQGAWGKSAALALVLTVLSFLILIVGNCLIKIARCGASWNAFQREKNEN